MLSKALYVDDMVIMSATIVGLRNKFKKLMEAFLKAMVLRLIY